MKNISGLKNDSGITITTLVITIILLLIIATVAINSGMDAVKSTELTVFTAELKIMQTQVNDLYEKYSNNGSVVIDGTTYKGNDEKNGIQTIGEDRSNGANNEIDSIIRGMINVVNDTPTEEQNKILNSFKFYSNDLIKKLGIEGTEQNFYISVPYRMVISELGLQYDNNLYYTLDELPNNLYNVKYEDKNKDSRPQIEITDTEAIDNESYKISTQITYTGKYVNKGKIRYKLTNSNSWNETEDDYFIINQAGVYDIYFIDSAGNESDKITRQLPVFAIDASSVWKETAKTDEEWYSYGGEKVNAPRLKGIMSPVKYTGDYDNDSVDKTNLWANAITADGSMWVWIPRYAYKITEGYTKKDKKQHNVDAEKVVGNIEIKFIDVNNNFLDGTEGKAETDPSKIKYENGTGLQQQWLVHPAFTANPENGGWDEELEGIWVAKFEATGTYDETSNTGKLSVLPGQESLRDMTINQQYKLGKTSSFDEKISSETLGSHMAKNSEWGATAYLSYSKFGTNKSEIAQNTSSDHFTGGTSEINNIYRLNYLQSTTGNATGVYDMNGGSWEYVAGYVDWRHSTTSEKYKNKYSDDTDPLLLYGGNSEDDLFGNSDDVRTTSTKYKTVYTEARNE